MYKLLFTALPLLFLLTVTRNDADAQQAADSMLHISKAVPAILPDSGSDQIKNNDMQKAAASVKNSMTALPGKAGAAALLKKQLLSIHPKGSISAGYEYGVLPYTTDNRYPAGGFKTEGNLSFSLLKLPLQLNYYYTSIKNTIGLTNYFRISYDAARYRDQVSQQAGVREQLLNTQLGQLKGQQQQIMRKLSFLNFMEKNPGYKMPQLPKAIAGKGYRADSLLPDTASFKSGQDGTGYPDSLAAEAGRYKNKYGPADSAALKDAAADSILLSSRKDSIARQILLYKQRYDSISDAVSEIRGELDKIGSYRKNPALAGNPYLSKTQQFLSHIKKFEIGLCHPASSLFLVNNIPLQGINAEYEKSGHFVNVLYGTTLNNLLYNPHTIDGAVQGARNYYNYFDFGNLEAGRKIFALKGGIGSKDGTHLFAGFMIGRGKSDYLFPAADGIEVTRQSNLVLELDGKYKFSAALSAELVLGKSSVQEEDVSSAGLRTALNEIFSDYRSYALMARINASVKKTKTNITLTTRWIDPYFKSFGIGFMRSDNLRYELKAEQPLGRKLKYSIAFRREEDNLLRLYDYKNIFYTVSNTLNVKLSRQFNLRLIYSPLYRQLRYGGDIRIDRNNISTVLASWTPKLKRISVRFNALYSRYLIQGDSGNINFENFTYSSQFLFRSGFKTDLSASWFKNNLSDTTGNNTYLGLAELGYTAKNHNSISAGGKIAWKKGIAPQYGFIAKVTLKVLKNLYYEASAEKIIIGDYYNSFDIQKIKKFPYYCSTRLILNF